MAWLNPKWQEIKDKLVQDYGSMCFNCFKKYSKMDLYVYNVYRHQKVYRNTMLLCKDCREQIIRDIPYGSEAYWKKMNEIAERLDKHIEYPYRFKKGT